MAKHLAKKAAFECHLSDYIIAYFTPLILGLFLRRVKLGVENSENLPGCFLVQKKKVPVEECSDDFGGRHPF